MLSRLACIPEALRFESRPRHYGTAFVLSVSEDTTILACDRLHHILEIIVSVWNFSRWYGGTVFWGRGGSGATASGGRVQGTQVDYFKFKFFSAIKKF